MVLRTTSQKEIEQWTSGPKPVGTTNHPKKTPSLTKIFFEMDRNPISPLKNWDVTPAWTNKWTWKSTVLPDLEPVILVHQCKMDSPNRRSVPLHLPKPPPLSLTPFVGCNQKKPIQDQSKEPEERKKEKKEKKRPETLDKDSRTLSYFPLPTQAITPDHWRPVNPQSP